MNAKEQAELYLDVMGHDITNMNQALMGYLEMIEEMRKSGEIELSLIENSIGIINRSSRLISNVKKLTLLQVGNVPLKDVDVCKMLSGVKERFSTPSNRSVTVNYLPRSGCLVKAGDLLADVFDNLVDNAIQHSAGPLTIDITVEQVSSSGGLHSRITVADNGPGIPDKLKKKIFATLGEIERKTERRGFGLYLAKTVVEYYHGHIWVEDRVPGDYTQGAKFVVLLQLAA